MLSLRNRVPIQNVSYHNETQTIINKKASNIDIVIPSISWPWPSKETTCNEVSNCNPSDGWSTVVLLGTVSSVQKPTTSDREISWRRERESVEERRVRWGILGPGTALREINLHYECSVRLKRMICHCEPLLWRSWCTGLDKEKDIHQWLEIFLDDKSSAQGRAWVLGWLSYETTKIRLLRLEYIPKRWIL